MDPFPFSKGALSPPKRVGIDARTFDNYDSLGAPYNGRFIILHWPAIEKPLLCEELLMSFYAQGTDKCYLQFDSAGKYRELGGFFVNFLPLEILPSGVSHLFSISRKVLFFCIVILGSSFSLSPPSNKMDTSTDNQASTKLVEFTSHKIESFFLCA